MKKVISILLITISAITLKAQEQTFTQIMDSTMTNNQIEITTRAHVPYKASVGGILLVCGYGPSFKTFFTGDFAFQTDIFFKLLFTPLIEKGYVVQNFTFYSSISINPNFMYQKKIKTKDTYDLFFFTGTGVSLGITPIRGNGKFGVNAILGLELVFIFPLTVQFDIRPGYGLLFNSSGYLNDSEDFNTYPCYSPWHHFDWSFGITFRWTYKKK
jgi:hypothetical protein